MEAKKKNPFIQPIIWIIEGILVGFGAILPGISGGTLLIAFGMYKPIIDLLSNPFKNIKKYIWMLGFFAIGGVIGFVVLSGLAAYLMEKNTTILTCVFAGFIFGTVPELLEDAVEKEKRNKWSYISMAIGFVVMILILSLLKLNTNVTLPTNLFAWIFCGIIWGLSFIVPGLSSSSLLLFFGLYQPMLYGISKLNFGVIIPLVLAALACILLLSKGINKLFDKHHGIASHVIVGIVIATTLMILPSFNTTFINILFYLLSIGLGGIVSFFFTRICKNLKKKYN